MRNSDPITYKGVSYPSTYVDAGETIGTVRISTIALEKALVADGIENGEAPREAIALDETIAYFLEDEEFRLPLKEVKKIIRTAYDEEPPPLAKKAIRELKKGEFFRLKDSDTAPVWIRGEYFPSEKKYNIYKFDDVNHEALRKGNTMVFVGFTL